MDKNSEVEKRLLFQGGAVALGAHIRRPDDHLVPAVASCYLPVTGGLAEGQSGPQRIKDVISFESASSRVQGDYADVRRAADFTHGNFQENELAAHIFVESSLKGLRLESAQDPVAGAAPVVRHFSAGHLYARLESVSDRKNPVSFRSLETAIEGVTIDGHRLKVMTAPRIFAEYDTHEKLLKAYAEDSDFRKQYGSCFFPTGREKTGISGLLSRPEIPNNNGLVLGTVVSGIEWETTGAPGAIIAGNRLDVKGIGTFFFGEIVIEPSSHRVTLLRFQLGSPCGGDGSAVEVHAMFQHWPPAL